VQAKAFGQIHHCARRTCQCRLGEVAKPFQAGGVGRREAKDQFMAKVGGGFSAALPGQPAKRQLSSLALFGIARAQSDQTALALQPKLPLLLALLLLGYKLLHEIGHVVLQLAKAGLQHMRAGVLPLVPAQEGDAAAPHASDGGERAQGQRVTLNLVAKQVHRPAPVGTAGQTKAALRLYPAGNESEPETPQQRKRREWEWQGQLTAAE
jgi:hypothetical protein